MKNLILTGFFISTLALTANAADLAAKYECSGQDPFTNRAYKGVMTTQKNGNTYKLDWNYGEDGMFTGTAFFDMQDPMALVMGFHGKNNEKNYGVQIYNIQADGSLKGTWTLNGADKVATEECRVVMVTAPSDSSNNMKPDASISTMEKVPSTTVPVAPSSDNTVPTTAPAKK